MVGLVVIKTGLDLTRGSIAFAYQKTDDVFLGIFLMIIGAYFVFSSLSRKFFERSE